MAIDQRSHPNRRGGRLLEAIRRAEPGFGQLPQGLDPGDHTPAAFLVASPQAEIRHEPVRDTAEPDTTWSAPEADLIETPAEPALEDLYPEPESPAESHEAFVCAEIRTAPVYAAPPRPRLNLPRSPEIEELAKVILEDLPKFDPATIAFVSVDRISIPLSVAAGVATAIAGRQSDNVLLVEADVAAYLAAGQTICQPKPGLTEIFTQQVSWPDAVLSTPLERLSYLPAGLEPRTFPIDADSAEQLFAELKRRFQFVIVDGGIAIEASRAGWLAKCDRIFLAVEQGRTTLPQAREATSRIASAGGRVHGSILIAAMA